MSTARSYHHGDLPAALLEAVAEIIDTDGLGAVSLRATARRAGVSHAAPAHHFGDRAGLLSAFAAVGFRRLRQEMLAALTPEPDDSLLRIGLGYIRFAVDERAHFEVMFRPELLDVDDADYAASRDAAFAVLCDTVRRYRPELPADDVEHVLAATGAWSIVHGFATLWLDGALDAAVTALPLEDAATRSLLAFGAALPRD